MLSRVISRPLVNAVRANARPRVIAPFTRTFTGSSTGFQLNNNNNNNNVQRNQPQQSKQLRQKATVQSKTNKKTYT